MNWISVEDRLPEGITIDCKVKTNKGNEYQPYFYAPMSGCFMTDIDSPDLPYSFEETEENVTHWCEITEPSE